MGAVHECGQRYIHVHEGLAPRHATGGGRAGSFVPTTSDVVGEMCTMEENMIICTKQRIVGFILLC